MADRIVIMNGGEIAQAGSPQEVYNKPNSDFVAAFMGAENVVEINVNVFGNSIGISEGRNNRKAVIDRGDRQLASGKAIARFRSEAVRMTAAGDTATSERDGLVLTGNVAQVSYPGGLWRHVVHLGETSLIVDSATRFDEGAAVEITVPEPALYIFPRQ